MTLPKSYSHHGYFQLPPDSTGKNMGTTMHLHVDYGSGTQIFNSGEIVTGSVSGCIAEILDVVGTISSGTLIVIARPNSEAADFTVGEKLVVDTVEIATVTNSYVFHTQGVNIVSSDNPHYGQRIGPKGAAYVRYSDGEQQLDGFGLARQSTPSQMAQYMFAYDEMPTEFLDETNGAGASISHLMDESSVALDVGFTSGEHAIRTTHRYHLYQAGYPTLAEMTVTVGDEGKANVRRRWGFFDGTDGCFFELDGTDLYVVLRSSTSGTPVDTRIHQDDWNGDRVNGELGSSNLSEMTLNLATINLYWIDVQWLGAGKVRYGIYDDEGSRIICHTIFAGNTNVAPFMSQANLPIRMEIENTDT